MHNNLKKTLIVSSYAPPALGGPQNLYNLLRNTNPSSYFILTSFYNIDNLSAKIGTWLQGEYIFYDNISANKNIVKSVNTSEPEFKKRFLVVKLKHFVKRFTFLRNIVGIGLILSQIVAIVLVGRKAIKNKNIDVIIGFSDYGPAMIGSYFLQKITKKNYTVFLFDIYKGNYFPFPGNFLAKIFEPCIFRSAQKIIVTNEGTRDFYVKRYGNEILKKIVIIHNSAFKEGYLKLEKPYNPKSPYSIVFTGRIYWPQIGALKNLTRAVSEINDLDIKIKIYSPSPKDYLKEIGIIESEKVEILVAPPEKMPEIQGNADILFLPLSWHTESQAIIDTATPGKLTDYLIAGRPMLIHAPASTFLAKYATNNNFAMVVDEENIQKLKDGIKKILENKEFSEMIIKNARETFLKNHDAEKNALLLKNI